MKADEIRRLIINDLFLNMDDDDAEDTLERIDEYAAEVSREAYLEGSKYGDIQTYDEYERIKEQEEL